MAKHKDIVIGGKTIKPGETKEIELFVSRFYDYTTIKMPVKVIRGKENGPRLFVCAAIHGDEVNGVEIIKRLLKAKSLKDIKGTLIVVPIVNVVGFNNLSRYLPDRRDLNRCFPGSDGGPLASRIAHLFVNEILNNCTHGIDLHTGAAHRVNLPQVRACFSNKDTEWLANQFDVPVIMDAEIIDGSLRKYALAKKIPLLVFEGGEALRYDEVVIRSGFIGILSVMRALGMIKPASLNAKKVTSFRAKGSYWERAPHSGIFIIKNRLGNTVKKGDVLGVISDPLGNNNTKIKAKKKGIIIGHTQLPLVNRGDALYHIATFDKIKYVGRSMEQFDDKFDYEER